jgi:hypothetical protein
MDWRVKHDRDAFKEVWLLFENRCGRFPLYPGESMWIEYAYSVTDTKWGRWFQRAVRLPTEHQQVRLTFPRRLDPVVWDTETSMTAEATPLRTPPVLSSAPRPSSATRAPSRFSPGPRPNQPSTPATVWSGGSEPGPEPRNDDGKCG